MNYNLHIEKYTNTSLQSRKNFPKNSMSLDPVQAIEHTVSIKGLWGKPEGALGQGGGGEGDLLSRGLKETGAMKGEKEEMGSDFNREVAGR